MEKNEPEFDYENEVCEHHAITYLEFNGFPYPVCDNCGKII